MTGEMGTLATFDGPHTLFDATLAKLAPRFAEAGHVGWVNLNLIVNADGVWPLEFTCRFGYPGVFVLAPLQRVAWGSLLDRVASGACTQFETAPGWSVGIVLTIPPFPRGEDGKSDSRLDPPIFFLSPVASEHLHWVDVRQMDKRLFARRRTGYVAVATGTGATIAAARADAMLRADQIIVPDLRFRSDIGATGDANVACLRMLGW
jgi:phosphoribosylamine--glycine ligase